MHEGVLRDDLSNGFHKAVFSLRSVTIRLELTDEYQRPGKVFMIQKIHSGGREISLRKPQA